jgi:hypothetical protein
MARATNWPLRVRRVPKTTKPIVLHEAMLVVGSPTRSTMRAPTKHLPRYFVA